MFRLVAYAPDGVRRFPVAQEEMLIGSKADCDIVLPYVGVAQQHARLRFDGSALRPETTSPRRLPRSSIRKALPSKRSRACCWATPT